MKKKPENIAFQKLKQISLPKGPFCKDLKWLWASCTAFLNLKKTVYALKCLSCGSDAHCYSRKNLDLDYTVKGAFKVCEARKILQQVIHVSQLRLIFLCTYESLLSSTWWLQKMDGICFKSYDR